MLNEEFWIGIENWPLSWEIGGTWWFPFLESIHVIGATMVLGSIFMVDLRLLGVAATRYPVTTLSRELAYWTWGAFVLATITGLGMFITRAASHVVNPAFQAKFLLLLLAGANMAYFHFVISKSVQEWNSGSNLPTSAKVSGALSLIFWCGVMLAGRWIGHII